MRQRLEWAPRMNANWAGTNARQNIGQKFVVTVNVRESDQTSNVTCTYVCSCNSPSSKKGKIEKSTYSWLMEYIFLFIIY